MFGGVVIAKSSLIKELYKPIEIARMLGVTTRSVQRYCNDGLLDVSWTPTGRRTITRDSLFRLLDSKGLLYDDVQNSKKDVIYARVSTAKQKDHGDLDRQVQNVINFAVHHNVKNLTVLTEVGSGLNDNRKQLLKLLQMIQKGEVDRVFVNDKDRLTRFGFNYIKSICDFHGVRIIVVSEETLEDE